MRYVLTCPICFLPFPERLSVIHDLLAIGSSLQGQEWITDCFVTLFFAVASIIRLRKDGHSSFINPTWGSSSASSRTSKSSAPRTRCRHPIRRSGIRRRRAQVAALAAREGTGAGTRAPMHRHLCARRALRIRMRARRGTRSAMRERTRMRRRRQWWCRARQTKRHSMDARGR